MNCTTVHCTSETVFETPITDVLSIKYACQHVCSVHEGRHNRTTYETGIRLAHGTSRYEQLRKPSSAVDRLLSASQVVVSRHFEVIQDDDLFFVRNSCDSVDSKFNLSVTF